MCNELKSFNLYYLKFTLDLMCAAICNRTRYMMAKTEQGWELKMMNVDMLKWRKSEYFEKNDLMIHDFSPMPKGLHVLENIVGNLWPFE